MAHPRQQIDTTSAILRRLSHDDQITANIEPPIRSLQIASPTQPLLSSPISMSQRMTDTPVSDRYPLSEEDLAAGFSGRYFISEEGLEEVDLSSNPIPSELGGFDELPFRIELQNLDGSPIQFRQRDGEEKEDAETPLHEILVEENSNLQAPTQGFKPRSNSVSSIGACSLSVDFQFQNQSEEDLEELNSSASDSNFDSDEECHYLDLHPDDRGLYFAENSELMRNSRP